MKHPEWYGNAEHVTDLMKKVGLLSGSSEQKRVMRLIITYRYIEMMSLIETMMTLTYDDNICLSNCAYYKALNKAIELMEAQEKSSKK